MVTIPFIHSYSMNSHSNNDELDRIPNDKGIKDEAFAFLVHITQPVKYPAIEFLYTPLQ